MTAEEGRRIVDRVIIEKVLPQCYQLILDLLRDDTPKELRIRALKMLPAKYLEKV